MCPCVTLCLHCLALPGTVVIRDCEAYHGVSCVICCRHRDGIITGKQRQRIASTIVVYRHCIQCPGIVTRTCTCISLHPSCVRALHRGPIAANIHARISRCPAWCFSACTLPCSVSQCAYLVMPRLVLQCAYLGLPHDHAPVVHLPLSPRSPPRRFTDVDHI